MGAGPPFLWGLLPEDPSPDPDPKGTEGLMACPDPRAFGGKEERWLLYVGEEGRAGNGLGGEGAGRRKASGYKGLSWIRGEGSRSGRRRGEGRR